MHSSVRQRAERLVALTEPLGDDLFEDAGDISDVRELDELARGLMDLWSVDIADQAWRAALVEMYIKSKRSGWLIIGSHPRLAPAGAFGVHHALASLAHHDRLDGLDPFVVNQAVLDAGLPFLSGGSVFPATVMVDWRRYAAGAADAEF